MIKKWKVKIPELSGEMERNAYIYLPDDYQTSDKRYPVLYMFDGHNVFFDEDATYGKSWGMGEYMKSTGKDLIIVAVECNHQGHKRLEEYSPADFEFPDVGKVTGRGKEYMEWMVGALKPYIDETYPTQADRDHTSLAGSSMGGLMALYGVCDYNHVFKNAACISPSFWMSKDKVLDIVTGAEIATDSAVYIDYGSLELPNHTTSSEALIAVARMLLTRRVNVVLNIIPGGIHSESSWEKQIPKFMDHLGL
ncbi:MAG: alpha/beta hydrolase [Oscillospiraceae bacterium]|nr:alpha/beta hydrolase [Oscillospiraceae bacterium]